jgi:endonuclease/exonuclease/phosphatase (EEP) superfamily protein YafD
MKKAGFRNCFGGDVVRTHVLYGALDYIFVRGPIECSDARVLRGSRASDHDPIAAQIR